MFHEWLINKYIILKFEVISIILNDHEKKIRSRIVFFFLCRTNSISGTYKSNGNQVVHGNGTHMKKVKLNEDHNLVPR